MFPLFCLLCSFEGMAPCTSAEASQKSFGVNPHFLPSSGIYNPFAFQELQDVNTSSFAVGTQLSPDGLPYGFIWTDVSAPFHSVGSWAKEHGPWPGLRPHLNGCTCLIPLCEFLR